MKNGTSKTSTNSPNPVAAPITQSTARTSEDSFHLVHELIASPVEIRDFIGKVEFAKANGEEWVETTEDVIKHFNPNGLAKGTEYFIYRGIKVTTVGKAQEIEDKLNKTYHSSNPGVKVISGA